MNTITTVAELEALPDGTVMHTAKGRLCELGDMWGKPPRIVWHEGWRALDDAIKDLAPLTVLYRPDMPPTDRPTPSRDQIATAIVREHRRRKYPSNDAAHLAINLAVEVVTDLLQGGTDE